MTADQYVRKYHTISVPRYEMTNGKMFASNIINTPVDEYLNARLVNRAGYSHDQRWKLRGGICKFLKEHAAMPDTPVYPLGNGYVILNSPIPCAYVDDDMFKDAFLGKASPETLFAVIQAISYWRGCRALDESYPVPSLPDLVDKFLGMDCNGFVGHYMKSKYVKEGFKLGPSSPEEDYFYNRDSIRNDPADVRADDIVLILRSPNEDKQEKEVNWDLSKKELETELSLRRFRIGHIMVISSVVGFSKDRVEVMISESRTSSEINGGPQTRAWTIQRKGTYRWDILYRDREVHSIIKVKRTG